MRFAVLLAVLLPAPAAAQPDAAAEQGLQSLIELFKPYVIEAVPSPLYERSHNWGHQESAFHGLRWDGLRPRVVKSLKNDGAWRKVRLQTRNWPASLTVKVHDARKVDPERLTFRLFLSCQAQAEMEQQLWERGLRLYSGSTRARFQFLAELDCECALKVDTAKILPDFSLRLRVTRARSMIHDPVVEHIAGFGGTAARLVGDMLLDAIHQVQPSLDDRLLERVNKSIVRAGDSKEIRLSLSKLIDRKQP